MNILSRFAVFCLAVLPAVLDAENKPELVFHLPFDGDAVATVGGQPKPLVERNLQTVTLDVPPGTRELASGAAISAGTVTLQAYELRSYACPAGKPAIGCDEDIMSD